MSNSAPIQPQSRFNVTADDLRKCDWQQRLASEPKQQCVYFREAFHVAFKASEANQDELGKRVYLFLWVLASLHADYDSPGNPYREWQRTTDGNRSLNTDDFVDSDFAVLKEVLHEINNAEFRARIGDLLWECKRDFTAAQSAVRAFIESARVLKSAGDHFAYVERLARAAKISARKGFEKFEAEVITAIEAGIVEFEQSAPNDFQCRRLMEILLRLQAGNPVHYAALSERLASQAESLPNWNAAEGYWEVASMWHRRNKDESGAERCRIAAAECHIFGAEAQVAGEKPDYGSAAFWMGKGLEALRQASANPARIAAVHQRFLEIQKKSLAAMGTMSIDVSAIPDFEKHREITQNAAVAHVQGFSFEEALGRFAHVTTPTDAEAVKAQVLSNATQSLFDKIVAQTAVDRTGKVSDVIPPSAFDQPDEGEVLRKKMVQQAAQIHWPMQVDWKIEPARQAFMIEHAARKADLRFLVVNNAFIPRGHEGIYLRGIQAGFHGDWLVAMHLLVPQVEASLRLVFQQHGVVTSTLDSEGLQKEKDINTLLWIPEMERIFGPDISFDLRGILVERFGHNMRNDSAHALMPEGSFYQPASVYLWWLIIHLCWRGHMVVGPVVR